MGDWVQFWITAVLLFAGLIFFAAGVMGNCRFQYVMNRVHAAGIGDTMGLLVTMAALAFGGQGALSAVKLFLPVLFLWITSPISSHFIGQIEYYTDKHLYDHMERKNRGEK